MARAEHAWRVEPAETGAALAGFLRARLPGQPWSVVKRWIAGGKVFVDDQASTREGRRLVAGQHVEVRLATPGRRPAVEVRLVFEDTHLVVVDKPAGVSSVPYEEYEQGTAMDLVRDAWRRMGRPATATPLFVVHRIDKDTSGLLVFAKSKRAERGLAAQLRTHAMERTYLCVAHGAIRAPLRIESELVADRGDGLRGSARRPGLGKRAVTHVKPLRALRGATLCEVRLETGKTHQIRIHLAERGHPLVGERVYVRDYLRRAEPIASPRLLLHAASLGFMHPITSEALRFESPLPADFELVLARLSTSGGA